MGMRSRGRWGPLNRSLGGLSLTSRAHALLVATRDAVRLMDEALPATDASRRLRGGATGPVLPLLAEAVADSVGVHQHCR